MDLPYFLHLVKQNSVLYALISAGNITAVDLQHTPHQVWSDAGVELLNFCLSPEETFSSVMIGTWPAEEKRITVRFRTSSSRYFDDPVRYFGQEGQLKASSLRLNGQPSLTQRKLVGHLAFPDRDVLVMVFQSSEYGNVVTLDFRLPANIEKYPYYLKYNQNTKSSPNYIAGRAFRGASRVWMIHEGKPPRMSLVQFALK